MWWHQGSFRVPLQPALDVSVRHTQDQNFSRVGKDDF